MTKCSSCVGALVDMVDVERLWSDVPKHKSHLVGALTKWPLLVALLTRRNVVGVDCVEKLTQQAHS